MITIQKIETPSHYKAFVRFPFTLYKDNPYWVPPIISEELKTIDKNTNPVFKNASAEFFLAYKGNKVVGRIAAIVNWIEVNELKKPKVRFGWYDATDDIEVTKALLNEVESFGKKHNLDFIEGPVGFSNLDKAGLLVLGFEEMNTMITQYNFPYYAEHLLKLNYIKLAQWVEYEIKIFSFEKAPERVKHFAGLVLERYQLKLLNFKTKKDILLYADQMFELLGKTYNKLQTFVPIQPYQIEYYKEKYIKYIHPDFIKCIVDANNQLVAFGIIMPSFSRSLKKANGRLFPFGFLHLLYARHFNNRASFYLIGIHPDYQRKGVSAIIFNEIQKICNARGITTVETNPELEENKAIQQMWKNYDNRLHKKRATFTKTI